MVWPRLEHAETEATDLVNRYHATDIPASTDAIKAYLNGTPRTRILHFAGHARYDPNNPQEHGLVLDDEKYLHPLDIRGRQLPSRPFVFLNACQAAAGYQMLGSCAGMVSGFVHAGASGVIAPIWSVDDEAAQKIARAFYRQVLEEDVPPAEAMRRLRARFGRDDQGNEVDPASAICLAYQFFGHPNLVLDRDAPDLEMNHA